MTFLTMAGFIQYHVIYGLCIVEQGGFSFPDLIYLLRTVWIML